MMDYFLSIYDINNWDDYILKTYDQLKYANISQYIIACLFKLHPSDLIITDELLINIRNVFIQLKICDKDIQTKNLIKLIGTYAKKYINNPNEELLFKFIQ